MNWLLYTLISFILYGIWAVFGKLATNHIGSDSVIIYDSLTFIVLVIFILSKNSWQVEVELPGVLYSLLYGITGMVGTLAFTIAISKGQVNVVTSITSIHPVVTLLVSVLFLNEGITIKQISGIVLATIGLVLIAI